MTKEETKKIVSVFCEEGANEEAKEMAHDWAEQIHSQFIEPLEKEKEAWRKKYIDANKQLENDKIVVEWPRENAKLKKENKELKEQLKAYLPKAWQEDPKE